MRTRNKDVARYLEGTKTTMSTTRCVAPSGYWKEVREFLPRLCRMGLSLSRNSCKSMFLVGLQVFYFPFIHQRGRYLFQQIRGHWLAPAVPQFWVHCGDWRLHCGAAVNMLEEALYAHCPMSIPALNKKRPSITNASP